MRLWSKVPCFVAVFADDHGGEHELQHRVEALNVAAGGQRIPG